METSSNLPGMNTLLRPFLLVFICMFVLGCTNSRLILRPLYNKLDDQFESQMLRYGSFSEEQTAAISDLVDHFHVWHRQTQLPAYELLLKDVAERLASTDELSLEEVTNWSATFNDNASRIGICNPIYSASSVLQTLTDEQVMETKKARLEILENWRKERAESRRASQTPEERVNVQVKRVRRYASLAGLDLNQSQLQDLRETMLQRQRPTTSFREIIDEWDRRFFELLDSRQEADWEARLTDYLNQRRKTVRQWAAETRGRNRMLWEAYFHRAGNSLDDEQRETVSNYLAGLANTVRALSKDEPSFTKASALDYDCKGVDVRW